MSILFDFGKLEPVEKLKKARIKIQQQNSFFGYMSLYLKFQEVSDKSMEMPCGVDAEGNFYYKKDWVAKLSDGETEGLIIHEIMHLVLMHLSRRRNRHAEGWNIAADLVVNSIAIKNSYDLPEGGLIPRSDEFVIGGKTIEDISKKTAEMIYDELPFQKGGSGSGSGNGHGLKKLPEGWDKHIEVKGQTEKEKKENEEKWLQRIESAAASSLMKGDMPKGLATFIKGLHRSQVNWRNLLVRHVQSYIPYDYSFSRMNKKSVSTGYYLPGYLKERIKILVGVDMSGSIGEKEVSDFMSEVVGLARAYQDRIEMILLTHDVDVHDEYKVENGVAQKLMKLKLHGGGGTSHVPIFDKINKKYKDVKVAIFLTDGCSDLENINLDKYHFDKIFVISKGGYNNINLKGKHRLIKLEE
jgi:predicted metal-dependent peptidase